MKEEWNSCSSHMGVKIHLVCLLLLEWTQFNCGTHCHNMGPWTALEKGFDETRDREKSEDKSLLRATSYFR